MRCISLAVCLFLVAGVGVGMAADAPPVKNLAARQAMSKYDVACKAADDAARAAKVKAGKELVASLEQAKKAAMTAGSLEDATAIAAAIEKAKENNGALQAAIPTDAVEYEGRFFKLVKVACTWEEARKKCAAAGGRLAIISDEQCSEVVHKLLGNAPAWIGLQRTGDVWQWVDGTQLGYSQWQRGEPNNARGIEHYASVWPDGWNDEPEKAMPFICEWNPN